MLGRFIATLETYDRVLQKKKKPPVLLIYFQPFADNHTQDHTSHFKNLLTIRSYDNEDHFLFFGPL